MKKRRLASSAETENDTKQESQLEAAYGGEEGGAEEGRTI